MCQRFGGESTTSQLDLVKLSVTESYCRLLDYLTNSNRFFLKKRCESKRDLYELLSYYGYYTFLYLQKKNTLNLNFLIIYFHPFFLCNLYFSVVTAVT